MIKNTKQAVVRRILRNRDGLPGESGHAFAPANIALCKYWGKRNAELNLPVTASLSVSLGELGSEVELVVVGRRDVCILNGRELPADSNFARRATEFLNLFRPTRNTGFRMTAINSIPTAAGLASSASGFAALTLALDRLFGWRLTPAELSILARLGSGSACRSIHPGFVKWRGGTRADGMDSHAAPIKACWPGFCLGLVVLTEAEKAVSSRAAMNRTTATSILYRAWPEQVRRDMREITAAIRTRDFPRLGAAAEANALAMHATMIAARPPVFYWQPASVAIMQRVWTLRGKGLALYFTMDAGSNLKLLFLERDAACVRRLFPGVRIVRPFGL